VFFAKVFPTKIWFAFINSSMPATCLPHFILLDLTSEIQVAEEEEEGVKCL
jgi:hypothetical protein